MSVTRDDFSWWFDDYSDSENKSPLPTSQYGSKYGESSKSTVPSTPLRVTAKPKRTKKLTYKLRETIETRTNK